MSYYYFVADTDNSSSSVTTDGRYRILGTSMVELNLDELQIEAHSVRVAGYGFGGAA